MRHYRQAKKGILAASAFLLLTTLALGSFDQYRDRFFPLFSWQLFSEPLELVTDFDVLIIQLGDQEFDPPLPYRDFALQAKIRLLSAGQPYKAIQRLGKSLRKNDIDKTLNERRMFESLYLDGASSGRYRIIRREWRPLAQVNTKGMQYKLIQDFGEYSFGNP